MRLPTRWVHTHTSPMCQTLSAYATRVCTPPAWPAAADPWPLTPADRARLTTTEHHAHGHGGGRHPSHLGWSVHMHMHMHMHACNRRLRGSRGGPSLRSPQITRQHWLPIRRAGAQISPSASASPGATQRSATGTSPLSCSLASKAPQPGICRHGREGRGRKRCSPQSR